MPFERHYPNSGSVTPKSTNNDKMIMLSEVLSKDIIFVKVDFYEANGKLYFGELTLFPGYGLEEFTPDEYSYINRIP